MDYGKLIALLNLSTSDNDHEALSAVRHANALLKKNNLRWENIIDGVTHTASKPPPPPPNPGKWSGVRAPETFNKDFVMEAYKSTGFNNFITRRGPTTVKFMLGLHAGFMKWGRLSEKQYKVFADIWNEFVEDKL